jgi:hypothetical protein
MRIIIGRVSAFVIIAAVSVFSPTTSLKAQNGSANGAGSGAKRDHGQVRP